MLPQKEQQIVTVMGIQIIHDGIDPREIGRQLSIHPAEKIQKIGLGSSWIALGPAVPHGLPQRAEDVPFATASIVEFLLGPLCWPNRGVNELLSGIAFRRDGSHLINVEDGTVLRRA